MSSLGMETVLVGGVADGVLDPIIAGVGVWAVYIVSFIGGTSVFQLANFVSLDTVTSLVSGSTYLYYMFT